jgi:hypothetical protein
MNESLTKKSYRSGWCFFNYPASPEWAREDFTCTNECASQFFANAHDYPGSNYWMILYELADRSDWWKDQFAKGWDHLVECRESATQTWTHPLSSTVTSTTSSSTSTTTDASTTTTTDFTSFTSTLTHSSSSSQSETSSPTASSTGVPENRPNTGGRLRPPIVFRALAWM